MTTEDAIYVIGQIGQWMSPKEAFTMAIDALEKQKEQGPVHEDDSKPQTDVEILTHYLSWAESDEENCPYTWKRLAKAIKAGIDALNQTLPEADTKAFNDGVKEGRRLEREDMQKEQKPDPELIKQSWYMEGYTDGKFKREPMWNLKTGEGGPRYEKNEKYGQSLEQKSAEWDEEYREEDLRTRFAFYTYKDEDGVLYLSNVFVEETSRNAGFGTKILAAAEKVAETIGAIDIRLKVKQDSPANAWYRKHGYGYMAFEGDYDWLEKTLEYLKPVKPAEWSEEDEIYLSQAIETLEHENYLVLADKLKSLRPQSKVEWSKKDIEIMGGICANLEYLIKEAGCDSKLKEKLEERIKWMKRLKSLRPQPHWRPSEEQMRVFFKANPVNLMPDELGVYRSLCNDLKKL